MKVLRGRARIAAGAGLAVAAAVTTVMAIVAGPAQAVEKGRCTDTVNVREKPDLHSKVIGKCMPGTTVSIDERRNGFVHLATPQGWASADYVKAASAASGSATPSAAARAPHATTSPQDRQRSNPSTSQSTPTKKAASGLDDLAPGLLR